MARVIRTQDIIQVLEAYPRSEWINDDWGIPGWRVVQAGRRQVNVFHDGPGEQDGLDTYRLALQAVGFHVVPDQQPGGGRRRLHITRP
ncbi:hypothetical protein [Streptomyces sp. CC224B]|uniref:hypothetical protein n=1 Tax=Streptomyces sp. CC224B TaxID=3044571 RepID=UPI0024A9FE1A|nr:hypothetical protein [Streptomyces sp. CC224B]